MLRRALPRALNRPLRAVQGLSPLRPMSSSSLTLRNNEVPSTATLQPLLSDAERQEITRVLEEHKDQVLNFDKEFNHKYHLMASVFQAPQEVTHDYQNRERNFSHFGWYPAVGFSWVILTTKELIHADEGLMFAGFSLVLYYVVNRLIWQHKALVNDYKGLKYDTRVYAEWKNWYGIAEFWEEFAKIKQERDNVYMKTAGYLRKYAELYAQMAGQLADTQRINAEAELASSTETSLRQLIQNEKKAAAVSQAAEASVLVGNVDRWVNDAPDSFKADYLDYAIESLWLKDHDITNPIDAYLEGRMVQEDPEEAE